MSPFSPPRRRDLRVPSGLGGKFLLIGKRSSFHVASTAVTAHDADESFVSTIGDLVEKEDEIYPKADESTGTATPSGTSSWLFNPLAALTSLLTPGRRSSAPQEAVKVSARRRSPTTTNVSSPLKKVKTQSPPSVVPRDDNGTKSVLPTNRLYPKITDTEDVQESVAATPIKRRNNLAKAADTGEAQLVSLQQRLLPSHPPVTRPLVLEEPKRVRTPSPKVVNEKTSSQKRVRVGSPSKRENFMSPTRHSLSSPQRFESPQKIRSSPRRYQDMEGASLGLSPAHSINLVSSADEAGPSSTRKSRVRARQSGESMDNGSPNVKSRPTRSMKSVEDTIDVSERTEPQASTPSVQKALKSITEDGPMVPIDSPKRSLRSRRSIELTDTATPLKSSVRKNSSVLESSVNEDHDVRPGRKTNQNERTPITLRRMEEPMTEPVRRGRSLPLEEPVSLPKQSIGVVEDEPIRPLRRSVKRDNAVAEESTAGASQPVGDNLTMDKHVGPLRRSTNRDAVVAEHVPVATSRRTGQREASVEESVRSLRRTAKSDTTLAEKDEEDNIKQTEKPDAAVETPVRKLRAVKSIESTPQIGSSRRTRSTRLADMTIDEMNVAMSSPRRTTRRPQSKDVNEDLNTPKESTKNENPSKLPATPLPSTDQQDIVQSLRLTRSVAKALKTSLSLDVPQVSLPSSGFRRTRSAASSNNSTPESTRHSRREK
jgi:hypothetical protein